jgi:hypothetical protein
VVSAPVPATTEMLPVLAVTMKTQGSRSPPAMKTFPDVSNVTPIGLDRKNFVATKLTEVLPTPDDPAPAIVVMMPVLLVTLRIR